MFFISQLFQNRSRLQPCKHWTQSQNDNRNNLIQHLDRREASSRLHSVVAYSVSNKTWAKCPASFSSRFWSASIQKDPPLLSFDFVTHSASGWDFLEAVLHLFCSDQSVAKVLAECTRKAGGQPERPRMLQTLQPNYQHILIWTYEHDSWFSLKIKSFGNSVDSNFSQFPEVTQKTTFAYLF